MGTKGTLVLEREQEVMLYKRFVDLVSRDGQSGQAAGRRWTPRPAAAAAAVCQSGRRRAGQPRLHRGNRALGLVHPQPRPENQPRCSPEVALGDAVIALATNVAIRRANQGQSGYVEFKDPWYDINSDETPDGSSIADEMAAMGVKS